MVEVHIGTKTEKRRSIKEIISVIWKETSVEPIVVFFTLPFYMSTLAIQNLSLEKSCRVNLDINASICDALHDRNKSGYTESDEIAVQKVVAAASIWKNVINGIFPAILLLLLGSWSDRNKRRNVLILIPILGEVVANVGFLLCTYFFDELPMEVNTLFEVLPTSVTGGFNMAFLGVFTYISTNTSPQNRTFRMGIIQTLFSICVAIGNAISGIMYNLIGFYGVFGVSLLMYILNGFYVYYLLPDDTGDNEKSLTKCELFKDVWNIKDTFGSFSFIKKASSSARTRQIWAILVLEILILGPTVGQAAVLYLYTRLAFNWDEIDYSIFSGYFSVAHLIGNFGAIAIFSKWLRFDDSIIGTMSSISKIVGGIGYTLAKTAVWFYISTLLDAVNGAAIVASRSMATKLVSEHDLGKVNSLFGIVDSLAALIYGPMYSAVYEATLDVLPTAFNIVGVGLTIPAVILYIWLYVGRNVRLTEKA